MHDIPDWARAWGAPPVSGRIRSAAADFAVDEQLSIDFSGEGEHDWLRVEKTGANTEWVARQLAKHAGLPARDVGYAGLKDRHAVTTQWFSVRRQIKAPTDWDSFRADGVRILERRLHHRKLKRGAHAGNAFRLLVRDAGMPAGGDDIGARLETIRREGAPNYFGEQRFGHGGGNVALGQAALEGRRLPRTKRSIGISALRALEFNRELDARVRAGTWNRLVPGEIANLDGSGSLFEVGDVDAGLEARCAALDIHPTVPLPAFETLGVAEARRPARVRVKGLEWDLDGGTLRLGFTLGKGCYATAVLREIVRYDAGRDPGR